MPPGPDPLARSRPSAGPGWARIWSGRGPLAVLLWPLSQLYRAMTTLHRAPWRLGWRQPVRAPVPVVVVGNVVAGGAGKTPVVLALVEHLRARGWQPGVISRGHGRRGGGVIEVMPDSAPAQCGDEPLLIRRRAGVPVVVARARPAAARALCAAHPACDILVSDDGLQHAALARDLELCVFDTRGIGNGWLLPAGPLREPWPRHADLVLRPEGVAIAGHTVTRRLAALAVRADGSTRLLRDLGQDQAGGCVAVAAIARPEAFFAMLEASGVPLARRLAFPDHYAFDSLPGSLEAPHTLICTEKDAVKLWRHAPHAWAVRLEVTIAPEFWDALDARLAPLSSPHGSQAARAARLSGDQGAAGP